MEFIVVLPTMLLLFFAIMELSRAWLTVSLASTAAREGARVGSVTDPFNPGLAQARITEILVAANLVPVVSNVVCDNAPCVSDDQVTATVTVTFDTVIPVFLPMLTGLNISRISIMRHE